MSRRPRKTFLDREAGNARHARLTAELARERALYEVLVDEDRPVEVIGACIARIEHLRLSLRQEGAAT